MTETGFWVGMIILTGGFAILAAISDGIEWLIERRRNKNN